MISGDLIRIKNLVDDCCRLARTIQREAERLTPEERTHLSSYVSDSATHNQLIDLAKLLQPPDRT